MLKIESGKIFLNKKEIDMAAFIGNISSMFSVQADKKGVKFLVTVGDRLESRYSGDELKLSQIIINLLGNALNLQTPAAGWFLISQQFYRR